MWPCLQVLPQQHGQTLPPWFPLMPSSWRAGKSSSQANSSSQDETRQPLLDRAGGAAPGGASVQVRDLRKVFHSSEGSVRVAVEGLTLDMCAGRVTALLGHNGAGKVGSQLSCLTVDVWGCQEQRTQLCMPACGLHAFVRNHRASVRSGADCCSAVCRAVTVAVLPPVLLQDHNHPHVDRCVCGICLACLAIQCMSADMPRQAAASVSHAMQLCRLTP